MSPERVRPSNQAELLQLGSVSRLSPKASDSRSSIVSCCSASLSSQAATVTAEMTEALGLRWLQEIRQPREIVWKDSSLCLRSVYILPTCLCPATSLRGCFVQVLGSECPLLSSFCQACAGEGAAGGQERQPPRLLPCHPSSVTKAPPESLFQAVRGRRCTWCSRGDSGRGLRGPESTESFSNALSSKFK